MMLKRITASLLAAFLFAHSTAGTAAGQTAPPALGQIVRAAEESLPSPAESEHLTRAQAARLVRACYQLAQVSPAEHERVCADNPALHYAVHILGTDEARLSAAERKGLEFYKPGPQRPTTPPRTPPRSRVSPPEPGAAAAERRALANALLAEIERLSMEYRLASVRGSLAGRMNAEARLRTLHADLRKALGAKGHLLPSDPHAFVTSKDVLVEARNGYKAEQRYFDLFTALVNNPDVQTTRDALAEEIRRLDALIEGDQPGLFHRARAEIEAAIDTGEWRALSQTREQRVAAERLRVAREWKAKFPAFVIPNETLARPAADGSSWSDLALESIRSYALEPADWVETESRLLAAYTRIQQRGGTTKTYAEWFSSLLTTPDLEAALLYAKAAAQQSSHPLGAADDLDPRGLHRQYFEGLAKTLQGDWYVRRNGGPRTPAPPFTPPDPELLRLQKLYSVQLIRQRYPDLAHAPAALKEKVRDVHTEFSDEDFRKTLKQYESFNVQLDAAARSNRALEPTQLAKMAKARAALLRTFTRIDEIFDARIRQGVLAPNPNTRKTKAIVAVLNAARPPNDPGSSPSMTGPPEPPSAPTPILNTPGPQRPLTPGRGAAAALTLTDAHFLSALSEAESSLREFKESLAGVETTPEAFGAQPGRMVVQADSLWRAGFDYAAQPLDREQARLRKGLETWQGLVNPATKKPYDFQTEVKNFKTLNAVGGGIHFGDEASVRVPASLSEFVLGYDERAQSLVLHGPGGRSYSYGPISPRELKALYRFAVSGHNAAISVGWAGAEQSPFERENSRPVLLHPAFVDTPVGQNLFAADSIPWRLGDPLPGGVEHPFAGSFRRAYGDYLAPSLAPLTPLFTTAVRFEDRPADFWYGVFNRRIPRDAMVLALASTGDFAQAKAEYLKITRAADYDLILRTMKLQAREREQLQNYLAAVNGLASIFDKFAERGQALSRKDALLALAEVVIATGSVETKWVTLWASLIKSRSPAATAEQLAASFFYKLPGATLAVLIDEPTTILLSGDRLVLSGGMRYRYATTEVSVTPAKVLAAGSLPAGESQVRDLPELTSLANRALPELSARYGPLGRTLEYAKVVAFLRWARREGSLLAIDFSSLAFYPASDRARTPTPDAVLSR